MADEIETESDLSKVTQLKKWYKRAESSLTQWRNEARECYRYVAGNQLTDAERAELREKLRPEIVFNRIDPVISAVVGHQINNRTMIKYLPRQNGDAKVSDVYSAAAKWIDEETNSLEEDTEAFWDMCVTGVGLTETRMSYEENAEGMAIGGERISPLESGWDPDSTRRNMVDAQYVYRGRWWDRTEAEETWDKIKDMGFMEQSPIDAGGEEPHDASRAFMYENNQSEWVKERENQIYIVQMQYWEKEPIWKVGDPSTGRIIELSQTKYNRLASRLKDMGVRAVKINKKVYKQAFFTGSTLLEDGPAPCPDHFTLQFMTGKRDHEKNCWYGIVRAMIDPQKWSNKFFTEIQEILSKNRTGGAFVEETALVNPRQAEEIWNDPNPLIVVRDGALSQGKIHERNPIQYPAGIDRLLQFAVGSIPHVTGMNMEMMGLVDREQAGVLEMQRKRAAMAIIAQFFDSLRAHTKARGSILLYFIKTYLTDGRLIRIVSGSGMEQYVPLVKQADTDYDVIVSESPYSPDQRAETFAAINQILPVAMKMGAPIPPEVMDYLPIPAALAESWKKAMSTPDPMAQRAREAQVALEEANTAKAQSTAQLNQAKIMTEQAQAMLIQMEARLTQVEAQLKPYEVKSNMMK